jgi:hypothetical protein
MLKIHLLALITIMSACCIGQTKATTTSGREVVLLENGKWYYVNDSSTVATPDSIVSNSSTFIKNKKAEFLLKSGTLNIGIYIDKKTWRYSKPQQSEDGEYNFTKLKDQTIAAFLVTEKTEIPLESLAEVALINAQKTDPQATVIKKEYRTVNGTKILFQQINCTIADVKFVFLGYYYCSEKGAVQLVTSTSEKQFDEVKTNMEDFLNGFVVL